MTIPFSQHFSAHLPSVPAPVPIASLYDAQVFARRWAIRDKDRGIKQVLRLLEKANSSAATAEAIEAFKQALSQRGLLARPPV